MAGYVTAAGIGRISLAKVYSFGLATRNEGHQVHFLPKGDETKSQALVTVQSLDVGFSILGGLQRAKQDNQDVDLLQLVAQSYERHM